MMVGKYCENEMSGQSSHTARFDVTKGYSPKFG